MSISATPKRTTVANRSRRVGLAAAQKPAVKRHNGLRGASQGANQTHTNKNSRRHGYRAPRTGEPRKQHKPLKIDRLPQVVKDAITAARESGETWAHTAQLASAAAGIALSASSVQRWHDLRVDQPRKEEGATPALLRKIVALLESIAEAVRK